ncbi:MAG: hypothetical protein ACREPR_13890, partial [Brasilonema sp.]
MCGICNRRAFLASTTAAFASAVLGAEVAGQQPTQRELDNSNSSFKPQSNIIADNVRAVGYSDLDGRPAFKISIREHKGRWY